MQNTFLHASARSFQLIRLRFSAINHRVVIALGGLLCLPALFSGYLGDDYIHHLLLSGEWQIPKANDLSLFGLFSWVDGAPERNRMLMDIGAIPWWTYEGMHYQFWRPLAELSHWLDHLLWRESIPLMHLHSVLWYLLLGVCLHRLYLKSGLPASVALVALAAFLLDSTHGFTLSWIANRNAIMAAVFGVTCLYYYLLWKETGRTGFMGLSLLFLGLSLLSGEIGISTTCYLGAHALMMDKRGPGKALLALWPFVLLSCLWWLTYKLGNFGANNSDVNYIDPLESPLIFASKLVERVPVMLFSQFGVVPAEVYGFSPDPLPVYLAVALLFMGAITWLLWPLIKGDRTARFWLLGSLFSVLPVTASIPADRNLLFVGLGASVAVGLLVQHLRQGMLQHRLRRIGAFGMVGMHLVLAPILLPLVSYSPKLWNQMMGLQLTSEMPVQSEQDKLLLFGVPMPVALATTPMRYASDRLLPERLWLISSDRHHFTIKRINANQLDIVSSKPLINTFEQALRDMERHPFGEGDQVVLSDMVLKVTRTDPAGHPLALRLTFRPGVLDTAALVAQGEGQDRLALRRQPLPAIGESLQLYAPVTSAE
ncbi:MAG: hypothetical protein R3208_19865 [Ketobacteraceae bacterium]|nr:hypothetical protein [Ketobacteraceae bacterium]